MEEKPLLVHIPEAGETLKHYLLRYTPDDRQRIYEHKTKSKELCSILVNNQWPLESKEENIEKSLENLWKILERLNNFRRLLHFIELLAPVRQDLLDSLDDYGEVISQISKWCIAGRMLSSTVDTASTIGGLFVNAKDGGDNWAMGVATFSGYLSLACSLSEVKLSGDAFSDLMEKVHMDQKYLAEIHSWYQKSSELEEEMLNIFPFDLTEKIVKEFIATGEDRQPDPVKLLMELLKGMKNLKIKRIKGCTKKDDENTAQESTEADRQGTSKEETEDEEKWTESLIRFVTAKKARELCYSLFVRRQHPIIFDIAKMAIQLKYSSWPLYFCQSVSALAPRNRTVYSVPVMGRVCLNLYSIYDGMRSIGKCRRHEIEIKQLRKHLECELIALKKIAVFIRLRSNGLIL